MGPCVALLLSALGIGVFGAEIRSKTDAAAAQVHFGPTRYTRTAGAPNQFRDVLKRPTAGPLDSLGLVDLFDDDGSMVSIRFP